MVLNKLRTIFPYMGDKYFSGCANRKDEVNSVIFK